MSKFRNWIIRKLGGYTEEQTKIVEKVVEVEMVQKPPSEISIELHEKEPTTVKCSIRITDINSAKLLLSNKTGLDMIARKLATNLAEQLISINSIKINCIIEPLTQILIIVGEVDVVSYNEEQTAKQILEEIKSYVE